MNPVSIDKTSVEPMSHRGATIGEMAARIRRGETTEGALADFATRYARARKIFRKKDD